MKRLVMILTVALLAPTASFAQTAPAATQITPDDEQYGPDDEQYAPDDAQYAPDDEQIAPDDEQAAPFAEPYYEPAAPFTEPYQERAATLADHAAPDDAQTAPVAQQTTPDEGRIADQTAPNDRRTAPLADQAIPDDAAPVAEQTTSRDAQTAPVAGQRSASAPSGYRLGAGDKLRVIVFGETDLTGEYDIAADGSMTFPLIGAVNAMDLTPEQLSHAIATRLQRGYLRDPSVVVSVITYRPFYILGEVEHPGAYPFAPNLDAMSAVAVAGGFTYRANRRRVFIRRAGETGEQPYTLRQAVPIQPGDTVRVGERFF
jgi:polysaccharide export outer membrane protein